MGPDKMSALQSKCARQKREIQNLTETIAEKNLMIRRLNQDVAQEEARVRDLEEAAVLLRDALEWSYSTTHEAGELEQDVGKSSIADMWKRASGLMWGKS